MCYINALDLQKKANQERHFRGSQLHDIHELRGKQFACTFFHDAPAFPAKPVSVSGEEGVDLIGHVLFELIGARRFDPRTFRFHDAETMDRTVKHIVAPAFLDAPFRVIFCDGCGIRSGFHEADRVLVGAQSEFDKIQLFRGKFAEPDGQSDAARISADSRTEWTMLCDLSGDI